MFALRDSLLALVLSGMELWNPESIGHTVTYTVRSDPGEVEPTWRMERESAAPLASPCSDPETKVPEPDAPPSGATGISATGPKSLPSSFSCKRIGWPSGLVATAA